MYCKVLTDSAVVPQINSEISLYPKISFYIEFKDSIRSVNALDRFNVYTITTAKWLHVNNYLQIRGLDHKVWMARGSGENRPLSDPTATQCLCSRQVSKVVITQPKVILDHMLIIHGMPDHEHLIKPCIAKYWLCIKFNLKLYYVQISFCIEYKGSIRSVNDLDRFTVYTITTAKWLHVNKYLQIRDISTLKYGWLQVEKIAPLRDLTATQC